MNTSPRFSPASLFGFHPLVAFFGGAPASPLKRSAPRPQAPKSRGTYPRQAANDGMDLDRMLAAARKAPELSLLEWDGDISRTPAANDPVVGAIAAADPQDDVRCLEPKRRKIRDRYIAARFPGVSRNPGDLANAQHVIRAARLLFEDEQPELALELLEIAIEESPQESALWLARLEMLFLQRDREGYVAGARAFREAHPYNDAWGEVERLGRAIAPGETLFGDVAGPRDHEHYGPWPHTPNWIEAPWDLTAEISACDFHRAMKSAA